MAVTDLLLLWKPFCEKRGLTDYTQQTVWRFHWIPACFAGIQCQLSKCAANSAHFPFFCLRQAGGPPLVVFLESWEMGLDCVMLRGNSLKEKSLPGYYLILKIRLFIWCYLCDSSKLALNLADFSPQEETDLLFVLSSLLWTSNANMSSSSFSLFFPFHHFLAIRAKMVDVVSPHAMPTETEVHVARSFLTKILRSSMRYHHSAVPCRACW